MAVQSLTRIALLRIRYKLTVHARKERLLLAEEAALVALHDGAIVSSGEEARALLDTPATADLAPAARDRFIRLAQDDLPGLIAGPISAFADSRAGELAEDHSGVRAAAGWAPRVSVEAVRPADVIGLFVLLPGEA